MMLRTRRVLTLVPIVLFLAVAPASFEFKNYEDFAGGENQGVSIASVGALTLAPQSVKIADLEDLTAWALLPIGREVFVATGEEGKIIRLGKGEPAVFFQGPEPFFYAITEAGNGAIYAGSSPDGKVYRVERDGSSSVFYEPQTKYIWALATDADRNVWIATGNPGKLIRVTPSGSASVMYETGDDQIRSLTISPSGKIYFGTSGEGVVYRLEREGKAFALYDSDFTEVNGLFADRNEKVYALVTSGRSRGGRKNSPQLKLRSLPIPSGLAEQFESMMEKALDEGNDEEEENGMTSSVAQGRSALLEMSRDGSVRTIWNSNANTAYAMAPTEKGTFLLGTGENGILLEVDSRGNETLLARLDERQINNVKYVSRDRIIVATSNPGAVYVFSSEPVKSGMYTSRVLDARGISSWGAFRVISKPAYKARTSCFTRTGNTQNVTPTWSDWEPIRENKVASPPSRFIQWKCELTMGEQDVPMVTSVEISYMPTNLPPRITQVKMLPPGPPRKAPPPPARSDTPGGASNLMESAQEFLQQAMASTVGGMGEGLEGSEEMPPPDQYPPRPPTALRPGLRTITWKASDPNRDQLKYTLFYRMLGESNWRLLKDNLKVTRYNWDTSSFPDGQYEIRVVASDDPSNPALVALSDELISDWFVIDNTPPEVLNLKAVVERSRAVVTFVGSDRWLAMDGCDYAIDAGDWNVILPTDGIPDSQQEYFAFTTPELSRGEHSIMVRVRDIAQNTAYASITISVP